MKKPKKLNKQEIKKAYELLSNYYEKFLKDYGVQLPKLKNAKGKYTKDALALIFLSQNYPKTKKVTKTELTQFIRQYYPDVNDVQQARHLGAQKGWYILAAGRDNVVAKVKQGEYFLYSLEEPYPQHHGHRISDTKDWEQIKKEYNYRCATCGSKENKPNLHWPVTITKLQKSHMNPLKPLKMGNIIPQCQKCNRGDKNRWVYDERGRVIKLAKPGIIRGCDEKIKWSVYRILYNEFNGVNPNDKK